MCSWDRVAGRQVDDRVMNAYASGRELQVPENGKGVGSSRGIPRGSYSKPDCWALAACHPCSSRGRKEAAEDVALEDAALIVDGLCLLPTCATETWIAVFVLARRKPSERNQTRPPISATTVDTGRLNRPLRKPPPARSLAPEEEHRSRGPFFFRDGVAMGAARGALS